MRICYLCPDLGITLDGHKGAAAHVRGFIAALARLGHQVIVVAPGGGKAAGAAEVVPIPVPELAGAVMSEDHPRMGRALGHIWNNVQVEKVLASVRARYRPDLTYERYSPFGIAGSLLSRQWGVPHILEVNALLSSEGDRYRRQAMSETSRWLERRAFEAAAMIVAVSEPLRESLLALGVPPEKVVTVANGVDAGLFAPAGPSRRGEFAGKTVVGFAGSLKPWHDLALLADAFAEIAQRPEYHLLVVGEGPAAGPLRSLADRMPDRVTLTGAVPHHRIPEYVRAMDIATALYVAQDPFYFSPLKALEYMAAGRAVIATGSGQLGELVRHGETGWLVPPGDRKGLVEALRILGEDPELRRRLGERASGEVNLSHTWEHRAAFVLERARECFGPGAGARSSSGRMSPP